MIHAMYAGTQGEMSAPVQAETATANNRLEHYGSFLAEVQAGRSHKKMNARFIESTLGLIGRAVLAAVCTWLLAFLITMVAELASLRIHASWFMQPVLLFCSVGLPCFSGWMMVRLAARPRFWHGIVPITLLWIGETVAFYSTPCPACHSLETFSGPSGLVLSLPAAAAGWWLTYLMTRKRCEHPVAPDSEAAARSPQG